MPAPHCSGTYTVELKVSIILLTDYHYYYYYTDLTASFPGQPGYAGTRKVKPVWI